MRPMYYSTTFVLMSMGGLAQPEWSPCTLMMKSKMKGAVPTQVTLAYLLMLIFMTYNTWLCAAVVVGAAVGYFLFGWRKTIVYEESDHCH